MRWRRACLAAIAATGLSVASASPSGALPTVCRAVACSGTNDGVVLERHVASPVSAAVGRPASGGTAVSSGSSRAVQTTLVPGCPGNDPNVGASSYDAACAYLVTYCATSGHPGGVLTWVFTRSRALPDGAWSPWVRTGQTCDPGAAVAAAAQRPVLTRALIQEAFARLVFSKPRLVVQPKGGTTLVNLPTYFEVTWPQAGVEPTEVASVTLLGRTVQIRPKVATYDYAFGDGGSMGPTASRGGPYPSGDVVHAYLQPVSTHARATARYSGDYSLDGGDTWGDVGLVVPVQGPDSPVMVLEGRARLEAEAP